VALTIDNARQKKNQDEHDAQDDFAALREAATGGRFFLHTIFSPSQ
jgi:hypothetical protein